MVKKELDHVSFAVTESEIKALNKYRKAHKEEDSFDVQLKYTGVGVVLNIRPKRLPSQPQENWENITDYGAW